jgi:hypothetical protein
VEPDESETPEVLPGESTVDAVTDITTTAVPHTSASLTFKNPAKIDV